MAIAENLKKQNKEFIILSDRHYSFFDDFSVNVELVKESPEDYLAKYSPEVVLTATSYTSKLELEFILAAKKKAIRTIVFVDHWTSINERFDFKGSDILPDDLLLIDDKAYRHAVKNNIPESICTIYGHPYHDFLKSWKPIQPREDFLESIGIDKKHEKILLFAPDPISNLDNGKQEFGFDETDATKRISDHFNLLSEDVIILCQAHPNQDIDKLLSVLPERVIVLRKNIHLNTLLYHSNLVLGFFSNLLIEAKIIGTNVLRYFPEESSRDPLEHMKIGLKVNDKGLFEALENLLL